MSYHALARKYRPATFAEMIGQKHVVVTLRAALRKDKLSHAYLFAGPRGTGKTTVARLLAKALNCTDPQDGDPCGRCEACLNIAGGSYLDVLEIDAASNTGVDNIRDLRDMAQYTPTQGRCRVFIIDEVHMLSKGAFNALLKILEEPPARVYFFFATTEPTKIPRTILSRCQRFDFRLLERRELSARIRQIVAAEQVGLDETALGMVVSLAEGSMRDALSILDQLIAGSEGVIDERCIVDLFGLVRSEVYSELNEAIIARDPGRALQLVDRLLGSGQGLDVFAQGVIFNFRNLLLAKIDRQLAANLDLTPDQVQTTCRQAEHFSVQDLVALIERASWHYERIHRSSQPRVLLEAALVEYTLFESRILLSDLVQRLQQLSGHDLGPGGVAPGGGSRPARASSSARETAQPYETAGVKVASTKPAAPVIGSVSAAAETVAGWTGFLQSLMQSHPGLASCLLEGLPSLDDQNSRLVVAFPPDKAFQMERLAQEREVLQKRIAACWGRPLQLQLVSHGSDHRTDLKDSIRRAVAPTEHEVLAAVCREDQPLSELVDLLQGEPVSDQEGHTWTEQPPAAPGPQR